MSARDEMVCVCRDGDTISTQEEEILVAKRAAPVALHRSEAGRVRQLVARFARRSPPADHRRSATPLGGDSVSVRHGTHPHLYLDTNVLLDAILHRDADSEVVLKRVIAHGCKCTTSRFTFAEMLDTLQKEEKKGMQRR